MQPNNSMNPMGSMAYGGQANNGYVYGYGQPPMNGYGQPPMNGYGQPPPMNGYGQPPPMNGYGAPAPPGGYGPSASGAYVPPAGMNYGGAGYGTTGYVQPAPMYGASVPGYGSGYPSTMGGMGGQYAAAANGQPNGGAYYYGTSSPAYAGAMPTATPANPAAAMPVMMGYPTGYIPPRSDLAPTSAASVVYSHSSTTKTVTRTRADGSVQVQTQQTTQTPAGPVTTQHPTVEEPPARPVSKVPMVEREKPRAPTLGPALLAAAYAEKAAAENAPPPHGRMTPIVLGFEEVRASMRMDQAVAVQFRDVQVHVQRLCEAALALANYQLENFEVLRKGGESIEVDGYVARESAVTDMAEDVGASVRPALGNVESASQRSFYQSSLESLLSAVRLFLDSASYTKLSAESGAEDQKAQLVGLLKMLSYVCVTFCDSFCEMFRSLHADSHRAARDSEYLRLALDATASKPAPKPPATVVQPAGTAERRVVSVGNLRETTLPNKGGIPPVEEKKPPIPEEKVLVEKVLVEEPVGVEQPQAAAEQPPENRTARPSTMPPTTTAPKKEKEEPPTTTTTRKATVGEGGGHLMQGWLSKHGVGFMARTQRRWFVLQRNLKMVYFDSATPEKDGRALGHIDVKTALSVAETKKMPFGFTLTVPHREYVLGAASNAERDHWIQVLSECLTRVQSSREVLSRQAQSANTFVATILASPDSASSKQAQIEGRVAEMSATLAGLEKLARDYGKDPIMQRKVNEQIEERRERLEELQAGLHALRQQTAAATPADHSSLPATTTPPPLPESMQNSTHSAPPEDGEDELRRLRRELEALKKRVQKENKTAAGMQKMAETYRLARQEAEARLAEEQVVRIQEALDKVKEQYRHIQARIGQLEQAAKERPAVADEVFCEALFDFRAESAYEVHLTAGDVIQLTDRSSDEWWGGVVQSTGEVGMFPSSYVRLLEADEVEYYESAQAVAVWDFVGESEAELSLKAGDMIDLIEYENESEWWYGSVQGTEGMFPASYVQLVDDSASWRAVEGELAAPLDMAPPPPPMMDEPVVEDEEEVPPFEAPMLYSFEAMNEGEISVPAGVSVLVRSQLNDEWLEVEYLGKIGCVPMNYVDVE